MEVRTVEHHREKPDLPAVSSDPRIRNLRSIDDESYRENVSVRWGCSYIEKFVLYV